MTERHGRPIPTREEIVGALEKTGFLLEQDVANKLDGITSTGWAFEDPDTGLSREIDVYSRKHVFGMDRSDNYQSFHVFAHTAIECKSYQWPWVVLTKDWDNNPVPSLPAGTNISLPMQLRLGVDDTDPFPLPGQGKNFAQLFLEERFAQAPRGVQLVKLNKKSGGWEAGSESIYNEITYPLAKVVDYFGKRFAKDESDAHGRRRTRMEMIFPVLVVTSPIYTLQRDSEGSYKVEQVKHVFLERLLQSSTVRGQFRFDIVSYDYIEQWHEKYVNGLLRFVAGKLPFEQRDLARANLA